MSDARTERKTVYDHVVNLTGFTRGDNETPNEFKIRALRELNGFSDEEYQSLPDIVLDWMTVASKVMRNNQKLTRPAPLPEMSGLDMNRVRIDINRPPEPTVKRRRRSTGEDAVSRICRVLAKTPDPEAVTPDQLSDMLKKEYPDTQYSKSAITQGHHAFVTARRALGIGQRQAAE